MADGVLVHNTNCNPPMKPITALTVFNNLPIIVLSPMPVSVRYMCLCCQLSEVSCNNRRSESAFVTADLLQPRWEEIQEQESGKCVAWMPAQSPVQICTDSLSFLALLHWSFFAAFSLHFSRIETCIHSLSWCTSQGYAAFTASCP